jgi:hypothetical protein
MINILIETELRELIATWRTMADSKFLRTYNTGEAVGREKAANDLEMLLEEFAPERTDEELIQPGDSLEVRSTKELRTSKALLDHLREEAKD